MTAIDSTQSLFAGRTAALGTMHGKEQALAPALAAGLDLTVVVPPGLDTDALGAFTGEVPRHGTPLQAARRKAALAMEAAQLPLGLASEGTFGPHPDTPFLTINVELVVLLDRERELEIVGQHVTGEAMATQSWVSSADEALAVAAKAQFPGHGLVVRPSLDHARELVKGIRSQDALITAVEHLLGAGALRVCIESDLRAHMNPTRMAAIARAAEDLVATARRPCPTCSAPGFARSGVQAGRACGWCGTPTRQPLAHEYSCRPCGHTEDRPIPGAPATADPMWCSVCNP